MTRSLEAEAARFARASGLVARGWRRPLASLRAGCGAMWYTDSIAFTHETETSGSSECLTDAETLLREGFTTAQNG